MDQQYSILTDMAGVKVLWVTDCEFEDSKLHRLFAHHIVPAEGVTPDHVITFAPIDAPQGLPADAHLHWRGRYVGCTRESNDIHWMRSDITGLDYLFISKEICIINDPDANRTRVTIQCKKGKGGKKERPDFREAVFICVHVVMATHQRYTVHAGAVEIGGKAVLLLGQSGSGKSTLCVDMVSQGAGFMGDDIVLLYRRGDVPMVGSLMLEAKLFPDDSKKYKDLVDVVTKYSSKPVFSAPLASIHLVQRSRRSESFFEPLHPLECAVELIRSTNDAKMQYDAREWQTVCQLMADKAPYSRFHFGDRSMFKISLFDHADGQ